MKVVDFLLILVTFAALVLVVHLFGSELTEGPPGFLQNVRLRDATPPAPPAPDSTATATPALRQRRPRTEALRELEDDLEQDERIRAEQESPWRHIVIHHSGTERGSAKIFEHYHRDIQGYSAGMLYHFVVGNGTDSRDGQVELGSRWREGLPRPYPDGAFAARAIAICLVGNFEQARPTRAQLQALRELISGLTLRYRIPPENIVAHREVQPGTLSPGRHFSLELARSFAEQPEPQ